MQGGKPKGGQQLLASKSLPSVWSGCIKDWRWLDAVLCVCVSAKKDITTSATPEQALAVLQMGKEEKNGLLYDTTW